MSLIRKTKKAQTEATRRRRLESRREPETKREDTKKRFSREWVFYSLFTIAAIFICFVGLSPAGPAVREDQLARIRVVAEFPFTYESEIKTRALKEERRKRVPPVYELDQEPFTEFAAYLRNLNASFTEWVEVPEGLEDNITEITDQEAAGFLESFEAGNPYDLSGADLAEFFNDTEPVQRADTLEESLLILGDLYRTGIFDPEQGHMEGGSRTLSFFNIQDQTGRIERVEVRPFEDALRSLRINLSAIDVPRSASVALFRIVRKGLEPNLRYSPEKTNELIEQALSNVDPVTVQVNEGDVIVQPNSRVTALEFEQLQAYRRALARNDSYRFGLEALLLERIAMTIVIVLGAALYLRISGLKFKPNNRMYFLSGGLVLINLLIARLLLEIASSPAGANNPLVVSIVSFLIPVALGPMIIAILVGTGPGLLAVGLIGVFNAMMQGNSFGILLVSHLIALVAVYHCRRIQVRARVVRAGLYAGLTAVALAVFVGLRNGSDPVTIFWQCVAGLVAGVSTGVIVVGFLPVFENFFGFTTDITLLELTDYNHPLLRKMQVEAPGSYHHSLMVANLAENAAAAIGANPLLCRVCSLYHDIGKMVKPEYFTENQRDGYNPHIERNPSMSALVIKSHVKEGVQLARRYKLPGVLIEVIRQHHGTTLIQYFYYKALEKQQVSQSEAAMPNAPRIELDKVNEDTYRYEGPRPQFVESAIIMLADSVEAAGRSLRKVTPQSIEELVGRIISARLEDGQLDDTELTFRELAQIKESFVFTSLNMLHSRVEYPDEAAGSEKKARKKSAAKREGTMFGPPSSDAENTEESVESGNADPAPAKAGAGSDGARKEANDGAENR